MEKIKQQQQQQQQLGDVHEAEMKEEAGAATPGGGPGWDVRGWEETAERWEERCEVLAGTEGWQRMKLELLGAGALNARPSLSLRLVLNGSEGLFSFFFMSLSHHGGGLQEGEKQGSG